MEILAGISDAFTLTTILYVFIGVFLGISVGCIPGLGAGLAIPVCVPLTYYMSPIAAIGFLVGINKGGMYGGSISAILINTPGDVAAVATTFDGYPMAQKGQGFKALKTALFSSCFGDTFSTLLVILVASRVASLALKLSAPEILAVLILALALIAALEAESMIKGIISAALGLLLATVGMEPTTGMPRFSFGFYRLENGFSVVTLAIGMLAVAEIAKQCLDKDTFYKTIKFKSDDNVDKEKNRFKGKDAFNLLPTWLRSSCIGAFIGACPGLGGSVAAFLSYGVAKKAGGPCAEFGKGEMKGIAAPESANNAVVGAALIPLFTLGIPGSVAASLLIGAFIAQGITPGPLMFEEHARDVYGIYGSILIGSMACLILGLVSNKLFVKVLEIPKIIMYPIILFICIMGTYATNNDVVDVYLMGFMAIVGLLFKISGFSFVNLIIGFVLGNQFELALQQSVIMFDGNLLMLFQRPISCTLMLITIAFIIWNTWSTYFRRKECPPPAEEA
ncbi:MAG: tripartite tricarboxylate transporter permease [Mailhella sp.]|nr:tripartite tricarboxylate transporter permease [Mailhella sp.]